MWIRFWSVFGKLLLICGPFGPLWGTSWPKWPTRPPKRVQTLKSDDVIKDSAFFAFSGNARKWTLQGAILVSKIDQNRRSGHQKKSVNGGPKVNRKWNNWGVNFLMFFRVVNFFFPEASARSEIPQGSNWGASGLLWGIIGGNNQQPKGRQLII